MSASAVLSPEAGVRPPGWEAILELGFEHVGGTSRLVHRRHRGPLCVQRPFYPVPEGECQVIVLHPPGGIVGGDRLFLDITVGEQAEVLITTPGATRFYRSVGATALLETTLRVGPAGLLEWVPQETLLFDSARAQIGTRVELARGARFLGWEITGLGLPASGREFESGACHTRWEIWREAEPLWIDRAHFCGGDERLTAAWGLAGHSVTASLIFVGDDPSSLDVVRAHLDEQPFEGLASATRLRDVLVCRALARSTHRVLDLFSSLRDRLRSDVLDSPASTPRIWAT